MRLCRTISAAGAAALLLLAAPVAHAQGDVTVPAADDAAFTRFVTGIRPRALSAGVRAATFDAAVVGMTPNPRVVALDRRQPGGIPGVAPSAFANFTPYAVRHVDAARINGGRSRYGRLRPQLARVEADSGVPEAIMLAIYGHETGYGSFSGDFDLIRSLATLAYEGRRRELFTAELIAAMTLLDQGVPRSTLVGSWAGATGYPQFLPSMILRLARDGDGDGRRDVWRSEPDALASIGAYLRDAGWRPGVPWGVAVRVPEGFDRPSIRSRLDSPCCPRVHGRQSRWLSIAEWRRLGVQPVGFPVPPESEQATLLEPDGPGATAYLLTTNYRSILEYNCSNFYALSVGLLADAVSH